MSDSSFMGSVVHMARRSYTELKHFSPTPTNVGYFILIAQERTGSTLLSDLLSFHPNILMDRHHFYTPDTWPDQYRSGRTLLTRMPVRGYKFKVVHAPRQQSPETVNRWLKKISSDVSIVRLQRRNKLRQGLSAHMVSLNKKLHSKQDHYQNSPPSDGKKTVDVAEVADNMRYYVRLSDFEEAALDGVPHIAINYETDLLPQDAHQSTANKIFDYLGLDPAEIDTRYQRLSTERISDSIANFDELIDELTSAEIDYFTDEKDHAG